MPGYRPETYKRSVELPVNLRDQLYELAELHERNLAEEIRHALRLYVALAHRQQRKAAA